MWKTKLSSVNISVHDKLLYRIDLILLMIMLLRFVERYIGLTVENTSCLQLLLIAVQKRCDPNKETKEIAAWSVNIISCQNRELICSYGIGFGK